MQIHCKACRTSTLALSNASETPRHGLRVLRKGDADRYAERCLSESALLVQHEETFKNLVVWPCAIPVFPAIGCCHGAIEIAMRVL